MYINLKDVLEQEAAEACARTVHEFMFKNFAVSEAALAEHVKAVQSMNDAEPRAHGGPQTPTEGGARDLVMVGLGVSVGTVMVVLAARSAEPAAEHEVAAPAKNSKTKAIKDSKNSKNSK